MEYKNIENFKTVTKQTTSNKWYVTYIYIHYMAMVWEWYNAMQ